MNELTLNIYNLVAEKISESVDWTTIVLSIIGILMAYYALLYNRARIEIVPTFNSYDFKKQLNSIKLCFHNVGSSTAFNIKIEQKNKTEDFFNYPANLEKYKEIEILLTKIDDIGEKALLRKTDINNHIIYNSDERQEIKLLNDEIKKIKPKVDDVEPLTFTEKGIDHQIRVIDDCLTKIEKRIISLESCLKIEINTLLAGENKINHLTDYSYTDTYDGEFKLENFTLNVIYDDIKKMDIFSILTFSLMGFIIGIFKLFYEIGKTIINSVSENKKILKIKQKIKKSLSHKKIIKENNIKESILIKLKQKNIYIKISTQLNKYKPAVEMFLYNIKMFLFIEFNLEKMEIIIKRKEVKLIRFDERIRHEDFDIQRKLNLEKHMEFMYKEFLDFLNSYIFQNWLSTLNKIEKQKITELLLNTKGNMNIFINDYDFQKQKTLEKKSLINKHELFLDKYINLIHIINNLPEKSPLVSLQMKERLENIIFNDNLKRRLKGLKKK